MARERMATDFGATSNDALVGESNCVTVRQTPSTETLAQSVRSSQKPSGNASSRVRMPSRSSMDESVAVP